MALKQDATKRFAEACKNLYNYLLGVKMDIYFNLSIDSTEPITATEIYRLEREFTAELLNNHNTVGDVVSINQDIIKRWFWPWLDEADTLQPRRYYDPNLDLLWQMSGYEKIESPLTNFPLREKLINLDRLADVELLEYWGFYAEVIRHLIFADESQYEDELTKLKNRMRETTVGEPQRATSTDEGETAPEFPDQLNTPEAIAQPQPHLELPEELNTDRAQKAFAKALANGWMRRTDTGYEWLFNRGSKASLGYFVERIYCPNQTEQLPEVKINRLFNVERIGSAISQVYSAKNEQKWRTPIDEIFND